MSTIGMYAGQEEIVVRVAYALGNVLTDNESARHQLYDAGRSMGTFSDLMERYLEKDLTNMARDVKEFNVVEDVLVKVIRVVVNMSIQPEIGARLVSAAGGEHRPAGRAEECERFLDALLSVLRRKSVDESEELVLAALAALNNLSYYADMTNADTAGPFGARQLDVAQALSLLLATRNRSCKTEVARVLGNLTRSATVRNYLLETGGLPAVAECLDSGDAELRTACCGVLVNMTSDESGRRAYARHGGVRRTVNALLRPGARDWTLYALACQTLWNACSAGHGFPGDPMPVLDTLVRLTDEERLFGDDVTWSSDEEKAAEYRQWEDFASVATNLLEWLDQLLEGRLDDVGDYGNNRPSG